MSYAGTYKGTIHTYCDDFNYTDQITFTIDKNGFIDLPYSAQGRLNDGSIDASGRISGIAITVQSLSLGTVTIPYSALSVGSSFSVSGRSSNGIVSTIQASLVVPKYDAVNDTAAVTEDSTIAARGNLLSNDTDEAAIVSVIDGKTVGASGTTAIAGRYGTLTISAVGTYSYALDDTHAIVDALKDGQRLTDRFSYTASNDGGASSATLAVTIHGRTDKGRPVDGTSGNDLLHGTAGADAFAGGAGTDTASYARAKTGVAASLTSPAGNKGEALGDTYASIENLTGSRYADTLQGHAGHNVLDGGAGADTLYGHAGNDTYIVDSSADRVVESAGSGTDTIRSSVTIVALAAHVENLVLTGTASLSGTGNGLANRITGNAGANTLDGGAGKDVLVGGAGRDTFLFKTAPSASNYDHIKDFDPVADTIALENAVFRTLTAGKLNANLFKDVTDGAALDANDRILYDHDTGRLSYDADGSGAQKALLVAILDTRPTLTFQDILVV